MSPNCRDCPEKIRERCIQEAAVSPSAQMMMRRAFELGSDSEQMWGLLQMNCLLVPKKSQPTSPPPGDEPTPARNVKKPTAPPAPAAAGRAKAQQDVLAAEAIPPPKKSPKKETSSRYCLILDGSGHRIALPSEGQLVLGRFDPSVTTNPDVDLSYDDREHHIISRRHARVLAHEGQHLIEDMGSTNGTTVNKQRLKIGQKILLQPGDQVFLGDHRFAYRTMPRIQTASQKPPAAHLWVTFTGQQFSLPPWGEVIVGRSDSVVRFIPDIDLADQGDVAQVVARRHIKISAHSGRHYVEDVGSANGTKLNGARLAIGERGLLEPGDHVWLGGCVLAYDVES